MRSSNADSGTKSTSRAPAEFLSAVRISCVVSPAHGSAFDSVARKMSLKIKLMREPPTLSTSRVIVQKNKIVANKLQLVGCDDGMALDQPLVVCRECKDLLQEHRKLLQKNIGIRKPRVTNLEVEKKI